LPDLRPHRRRHEIRTLEARACPTQMLDESLHLTPKLELGSRQVVRLRPVSGYAGRVDDGFRAVGQDQDVHLAPVERQRSRRVPALEDAPEAPQVNRWRVPQLTGRLAEPEVVRETFDVANHAVDVDVADLEEDAQRLREPVLLASLQELGPGQCGNVRV